MERIMEFLRSVVRCIVVRLWRADNPTKQHMHMLDVLKIILQHLHANNAVVPRIYDKIIVISRLSMINRAMHELGNLYRPLLMKGILLHDCPWQANFCSKWVRAQQPQHPLSCARLLQAILLQFRPCVLVKHVEFLQNAPHPQPFSLQPQQAEIRVPLSEQVFTQNTEGLFWDSENHPFDPPTGTLFQIQLAPDSLQNSFESMALQVKIFLCNPLSDSIDWCVERYQSRDAREAFYLRTRYVYEQGQEQHHILCLYPGDRLFFRINQYHVQGQISIGCGLPGTRWGQMGERFLWYPPLRNELAEYRKLLQEVCATIG